MNLGHYLFSFGGRINRAKQWAILLVGIAFEILLVTAFSAIVGFAALGAMIEKKMPFGAIIGSAPVHSFILVACALYALMLYIAVAVMTKRLHDRDKGAWWLLVFFVLPLVLNIPRFMEMTYILGHISDFIKTAQAARNAGEPFFKESPIAILGGGAASIINLWAFVELFCLRGTVGDNRFGPDPLAGRA